MYNNVYVRGCFAQIFDFENEKKSKNIEILLFA